MTTLYTAPLLSPDQTASLDPSNIPCHIAYIPDGNRRWAKDNGCDTFTGHKRGADNLMKIVRASSDIGIQYVTFYIFSTENWNRPKTEVKALMWLLENYLSGKRQEMVDNGVKFHTIGNLTPFSPGVLEEIQKTKAATKECDKIDLVFALNYGSRDEIKRAFVKMLDDYDDQKLAKDTVSEAVISSYLDTGYWPDPELLVRTSGEKRISNFLLWQLSYTEIYNAPVLWPDFTPERLLEAVLDYQNRERRMGGG